MNNCPVCVKHPEIVTNCHYPTEPITLDNARKLFKIPADRKHITFELDQSGLDEILHLGYDLATFTYFRKPSPQYRTSCECKGGFIYKGKAYPDQATEQRRIAWSTLGIVLQECKMCQSQHCYAN